jgi:hypothetical protein
MKNRWKLSQGVFACMTMVSFSGLSVLGGCLAADEQVDEAEPDAAEEEVFTATTVDLDQGGIIVAQRTFTRAEQLENKRRAEKLAREGLGSSADAISQDTDCLTPAPYYGANLLRLWDDENYTGNVLCFAGVGIANLADYCRPTPPFTCLDNWVGEVRSFKTGSYSAEFDDEFYCGDSCGYVADSSLVDDASTCVEGASYVWRDGQGCQVQ